LISRTYGGDEESGEKDEVTGSTNISGLAGWIPKLTILLDLEIRAS
jgi:hypothetical protein